MAGILCWQSSMHLCYEICWLYFGPFWLDVLGSQEPTQETQKFLWPFDSKWFLRSLDEKWLKSNHIQDMLKIAEAFILQMQCDNFTLALLPISTVPIRALSFCQVGRGVCAERQTLGFHRMVRHQVLHMGKYKFRNEFEVNMHKHRRY